MIEFFRDCYDNYTVAPSLLGFHFPEFLNGLGPYKKSLLNESPLNKTSDRLT